MAKKIITPEKTLTKIEVEKTPQPQEIRANIEKVQLSVFENSQYTEIKIPQRLGE